MNNELKEQAINNVFDYSNVVVDINSLMILCKHADDLYKAMLTIYEDDEKKNEPLKWELKNYEYRKKYSRLVFNIRYKSYNSTNCESYDALTRLASEKKINELDSFEISLELNYAKGTNDNHVDVNNLFTVTFRPYDIKFIRKSNYNEAYMNQIEENINSILKQFRVANTIFSSKDAGERHE